MGASGSGEGLDEAGTLTALRAPLPLPPSTKTTMDVLPTLLASAEATPPSDARGFDLRAPRARRAIFLLDAEGRAFAVRTDRHLLIAQPGEDGALAPVALTGSETEQASLLEALSAWRRSLSATTARERLGDAELEARLQDGGYWEASP